MKFDGNLMRFDPLHPDISIDDLISIIKNRTLKGELVWTKRQAHASQIIYSAKCGKVEFVLSSYTSASNNHWAKWHLWMNPGELKHREENITHKKFRKLAVWIDAQITKLDYDLFNMYKCLASGCGESNGN